MPMLICGRALLFSLAILALPGPLAAQDEEGITVGSMAPPVIVPALDGTPVDLASFIGKKPVLIEFWATWCTSCQAMMPRLSAMHARFGDAVEFIGINVTISETREGVAAYVREHEPPFLTLYDDEGAGARAYDPPATSFIVIADRTGRIVYTGSGGTQNLEPALRRVTGRTSPPANGKE
jgi:thiol-disulfide isomerase/thioredoxin